MHSTARHWLSISYRISAISLVAVTVGAVASLCAIGFVEAVAWLNHRLLVSPYARIQWGERPGLVMAATVLVPTLGGLVVGLLMRYGSSVRRALAPPDAILAVQTDQPLPSLRDGIVSTLAAIVSLGSGASVGQYGPMVYLGTLFGALAAKLKLGVKDLKAIAIACGVSAAIATAFNAPIAGLVFAHEVILRHYSLRAFAPVTVAAATGYVLANVVFELEPLFLVDFAGVSHSYEFLLFAFEGMLCALLAWVFIRLIEKAGKLAALVRLPQTIKPAGAGLALGLVALWIPEVLGIGQESLRFATIPGAFGAGELGLLVTLKLLVTALCVGFGFVGGVFSPALLIGILFGSLFGMTAQTIVPLELSGLVAYAIGGMMALASAVIGAPLTTILIVFELTRNYDLTIAAMVTVVFCNLVSYRMVGRSLFDRQLCARGFDLRQGRDRAILQSLAIADYASTDVTRADATDTAGAIRTLLVEQQRAEAVLTGAQGYFVGCVRLQTLLTLPDAEPVPRKHWRIDPAFTHATSVWDAMNALEGFVGESVPILDDDGRPVGSVSEEAVIRAYLGIVDDLRREENATA
ncbi:chloride channel protein [Chromohalobacter sarecensis]|uniref:Chloride channel protein n=1 Tax=Chromohalobacter sarecensis TaxID=245294 RepID=A0ABV9CWK4_9GAMM|nr:chloride channel protein [Chromohalobacter sarecensis]MCK0714792.1 chloride channel protein [Chromohalobacter sarecensis]